MHFLIELPKTMKRSTWSISVGGALAERSEKPLFYSFSAELSAAFDRYLQGEASIWYSQPSSKGIAQSKSLKVKFALEITA